MWAVGVGTQLLCVVKCESLTLKLNTRVSFQDTSIYCEKYCIQGE